MIPLPPDKRIAERAYIRKIANAGNINYFSKNFILAGDFYLAKVLYVIAAVGRGMVFGRDAKLLPSHVN